VVTGRSKVRERPYRIVELTPQDTRLNFGPMHALVFNTRYTAATFSELRRGQFDVVHHVLPFAIGRTYNLAALRHGAATPFVIGPVQAPLAVLDNDVNARDLRGEADGGATAFPSLRRSMIDRVSILASDVIAPVALWRLSRETFLRAATVVAVNEEAQELALRSGISPSRVVVIPPGVDTRRFRPAPGRWRGSRVVLLCVCHLVKRKNVDVIIRAVANVVDAAPGVRLRIVGAGPQREALTALTHALGLARNVTFAGPVPNAAIHEEYSRADVFLNASAAESFGTTCLEALAAGLPVVSTRVGEFARIVEDHRTGYLLDRVDADELAAKLQRLVGHPALIDNLSRRARAIAESKFDWDAAVIPKYEDLYERVIRENEVRRSRSKSSPPPT
jgi:glycosyltransferase involved in cell wall biosynthesis